MPGAADEHLEGGPGLGIPALGLPFAFFGLAVGIAFAFLWLGARTLRFGA